jgi:hypothetical protein
MAGATAGFYGGLYARVCYLGWNDPESQVIHHPEVIGYASLGAIVLAFAAVWLVTRLYPRR